MEQLRKISDQEGKLLQHLVNMSSLKLPESWREKLLVRTMNDGGMGSLQLFPDGEIIDERKFGKEVSEYHFTDIDGVLVIASLYVDENGDLFEMDMWKTDFSRLINIPDV